jgi:hypothetical protein
VSDALDRKGEVLAYKHLLLGWMGPKSAYMVKLVAENAKDVISWGYQVNFKIIDMLTPQGGLIGELTDIAANVVIIKYLNDYAGEQSRLKGTSKEMEIAILLGIMCLPFGMVYLVGLTVFKLTQEDWGSLGERIATMGAQTFFLPAGVLSKIFGGKPEEWFKPKP